MAKTSGFKIEQFNPAYHAQISSKIGAEIQRHNTGGDNGEKVAKASSKSKYGAKKVVVDGIRFDSIKESRVYLQLKARLDRNEITDLKLQVPFELNTGGTFSYKYKADFTYMENGQYKVVDAKGMKTAVYKKKSKLMKKVLGITVVEV